MGVYSELRKLIITVEIPLLLLTASIPELFWEWFDIYTHFKVRGVRENGFKSLSRSLPIPINPFYIHTNSIKFQ